MAVYQIYKLLFDRSSQRDLYAVDDGYSAFQKARDILDGMLKGAKPLPIIKEKRDNPTTTLTTSVWYSRLSL